MGPMGLKSLISKLENYLFLGSLPFNQNNNQEPPASQWTAPGNSLYQRYQETENQTT